MSKITMRWPDLDLEVACESIEENKTAFELFAANLPVKAVQGHEMVGGWLLRSRSVRLLKKPFDIVGSELKKEKMNIAPVGRISLLFPQGSSTEVMVKYAECVDDREYVPIAQVAKEDVEKLVKAGKAQWKSASRTKEVIIVEFSGEGK